VDINQLINELVVPLGTAMLCGFAIGFERQWHHKAAGLRTNVLACMGSALFVLLSYKMTQPTGDVTRIAAQVVTGIGFLGAGIIFKEGLSVHGLTTAVTIWCSSAIGSMAGANLPAEAIAGTISIVLINIALKPLDAWLDKRGKENP
jgi:putative Mg2+ transporter-C (MgtC) family protein